MHNISQKPFLALNPNIKLTPEGQRLWDDLIAEAQKEETGFLLERLNFAKWLTFCSTVSLYFAEHGTCHDHTGDEFGTDDLAPYRIRDGKAGESLWHVDRD